MDLAKWIDEPTFESTWKRAFGDLHMAFPAQGRPAKPSCYRKPKASYWAEVRKPCPGIRLIDYELPVGVTPMALYLRVWIDMSASTIYENLARAGQLTILGEPTICYPNQLPRSSWQTSLKKAGVSLQGLRYNVNVAKLLDNELTAAGKLRAIGKEFCSFVLANATGESGGTTIEENEAAPALSPPGIETVLGSTQAQTETLAENLFETWADDEVAEPVEGSEEAAHAISSDPRFAGVSAKTRVALINARVGQGGYRRRMLKLWHNRCAVSSCDVAEVLIASHARSWSDCDGVEDCLNEYNGLLLAGTLDRLFDSGLISFSNDGSILIHASLSAGQRDELGISSIKRLRFVCKEHQPFLSSHRYRHGFAK